MYARLDFRRFFPRGKHPSRTNHWKQTIHGAVSGYRPPIHWFRPLLDAPRFFPGSPTRGVSGAPTAIVSTAAKRGTSTTMRTTKVKITTVLCLALLSTSGHAQTLTWSPIDCSRLC